MESGKILIQFEVHLLYYKLAHVDEGTLFVLDYSELLPMSFESKMIDRALLNIPPIWVPTKKKLI